MKKYTAGQQAYYAKFKDPRWQKKRLEIFQRDAFECISCGEKEQTLNVHHEYYIRNRDPWDYPSWSLRTLCEPCHQLLLERVPEGDPYLEDWEIAVRQMVQEDPVYERSGLTDVAQEVGLCRDSEIDVGVILRALVDLRNQQ